MKNILKTVMAILLAGGSVYAADSGQITVQGTVAAVNEITVTPQTGYDSLAIASGATDQYVALVNERNNDPDGYTVTLSSLNADGAQARLRLDSTGTYVNYSMKYGTSGAEAEVALSSGSATVTNASAPTGSSGADKRLLVSFSGVSWPMAGTYADTVTLTIASK